ncbi:MAG: cytochrome c biogenesis protein ResB, partial [Desulfitobacteriaceae bacterium]
IRLEQGHLISDWNIRINYAREKFDARGQRDNWSTEISILQNGFELKREALSVNHPLTYQGITFYQTSFGNGVSLSAIVQGQKIPFALQGRGQNWFQAPGTSLYLLADTIGIENGQILMTYQALSKESSKLIQSGVIRQGEQVNIQGLYDIVLVSPVNFTGLVIKKDPGVPLIWLGTTLLILGLMLAFYFKPRKLWFILTGGGENQRFIAGLWSAAGTESAEELLLEFIREFG